MPWHKFSRDVIFNNSYLVLFREDPAGTAVSVIYVLTQTSQILYVTLRNYNPEKVTKFSKVTDW